MFQFITNQMLIKSANGDLDIPSEQKIDDEPKVNILITLEGGDLLIDDIKKSGLSELTAILLNESTKNYTTEEISSMLDNIGSSFHSIPEKEHSTIFVSSL